MQSVEIPRPSSVGSSLSSSMANRGQQEICVGEEVKIAVDIYLEKFRLNEVQKEMQFPSSLTATERAYVHRLCQGLGFKTKSRGKGTNRCLTVTKKDGNQTLQMAAVFQLVHNSRHQIHSLLQRYPVTNKERQDLIPRVEGGYHSEGVRDVPKTTTGRLNNGVSQVPPKRVETDLIDFTKQLPVSSMKVEILGMINRHQVVLISGETGSGKTTQVPQMILDDCYSNQKPCRIFCTQPRRISALSIAERVAAERAEKVGQTIGYQIRLESRVSPKTLLTFCTNGVLLRTLMGGDNSLSTVTHIFIDEVHERDRFSDFLLIALRDMLLKYRNLKLILMSAALNTELFVKYFNGCPVISVPGTLFPVEEYFLEDILKWTGYTNKQMENFKKGKDHGEKQKRHLSEWYNYGTTPQQQISGESRLAELLEGLEKDDEAIQEKEEPEAWVTKEMDDLLTTAWLTGHEEAFAQIFHLIVHENVNVDYQHTETSATAIMIAAGRGLCNVVEELLNMGASPQLRASNDWCAIDWARKFHHTEISDLLEAYINSSETSVGDSSLLLNNIQALTEEDRELLNIYHHSFDDEKVDLDLILSLLYKIHSGSREGAILVFLPGYDDIVTLRDLILYDDKRFSDSSRYVLYTLHSAMQSTDQKKVFKPLPPGQRKIILSTNIAETSITINDVVFIIDGGKVKEKTYDALTSVSMLKSNWISKASSVQRRGRAGRCQSGVCYHLFSRVRYQSMQDFQLPEILRFPLTELCLHTKMLAPVNCAIADFIARAPQPPPAMVSRNAVQLLKHIDALDNTEDLTELGVHLPDLPVDPRLGKMVLYSVVLKCLDPILTIVCTLAYRDPFVLPSQSFQKRAALLARRKFSADTYSDHMALLRAFQAWQKAKADGWEKSFCQKNFLSGATMEMIVGMRAQLLGQLRASGFVRARGGGDIRDLNTNSENWSIVKAALCAGMYPNLLRVDRVELQLKSQKESKIRFHHSSVLNSHTNRTKTIKNIPSDWMIYDEMTRMHQLAHVRCCTVVSPITLAVFGGPSKLPLEFVKDVECFHEHGGNGFHGNVDSDSDSEQKDDSKRITLRLDDWIAFKVDPEAANLALSLRQKWHSLFIRRMRGPAKPWSQTDEAVVRAVITVLTSEEQALGLQQPAGIGQRPRPMSTESGIHGGSRRGSYDTESSESSNGDSKHEYKVFQKRFSTPPARDKPFTKIDKNRDDRSETSSVRSGGSTAGSENTSLRSTPCHSPQLHTSVMSDVATNGSARYFVMKSSSHKNLDVSACKSIWATTSINERKLNKAYRDGKMVYLIFSVQGSGHFQGFARMVSLVGKEKSPEFPSSGLSGTFAVEWIKKANLPFQQTHHLLNSWNDNKKVQVSRDGQEIEPTVGESLIKLWDRFPDYLPKTSPQQGSKFMPRSYGERSGEYRSPPDGSDGQRHSGKGGYGFPGGQYVSPEGHPAMIPGHPSPFSQLYITPIMTQQRQMMSPSPGGMMMPSPPQMSPGHHHAISPIMILQRGSPTPRHHTPPHSRSPHPGQGKGQNS